ncbi:complement C1q-like protein 2 [Mya arenaria]|uniref:complement C1q-like protein 2 n=1 Tax=Mya arenaria TaxID=6604 RepID=UPI0022E7C0A6|nr:complement C1q-like protein 2 [Mya arenaria]
MKGILIILILHFFTHFSTSEVPNNDENDTETLEASVHIGGSASNILNRLSELENKVARLEGENSKLQKAVTSLVFKPQQDAEAAPTFVAESTAFHAYLSTDVNLNSHDVIKFDVEGTDTMNSYGVNTGIFTANAVGLYVFTITIHSGVRSYVGAEIVVNGVVQGEAFADSEEITDTHSSSATTVVQMAAGDQAWVRRGADSQSVLWSHPSRGRSTFTGWLLL